MTDPNVKPTEDPNRTSLGLLERVRSHDAAAWERLVALYTPLIHRWCDEAGLQEADASDVSQEVFLSANQAIDTFRRDRPGDTFRGWLRTITRNKIRDRLRRVRPDWEQTGGSDAYQRLLQVAEASDAEGDVQSAELSVLYRRALDLVALEFTETTWRAFWRAVVDGATPQDTAAELGLSVNAVYLAKGRVLARLREEFADLIDT